MVQPHREGIYREVGGRILGRLFDSYEPQIHNCKVGIIVN